jgi:DNA-binding cell septation regulator SpoVG
MNMKIKEIRLLPLANNKTTKAFIDLEIDGIIIRDFRIYQTNGKSSVRNPFISYRDHEGKLTFREIVTLPPNVEAEAHSMILSEFFRKSKEQPHEYRLQ